MSLITKLEKRFWKPTIVVFVGVLSLVFMKPDAYKDVTQELIALFGLMMAGVLPTMVLTASALRSGNLSIKKLIAYRDALFSQLRVWIGLFLVSLFASFLVIVSKMFGWSFPIAIPLSFLGIGGFQYDLIGFVNALVSACLALVILRGFDVGTGIVSLLRLSAEIALSEARLRDEARHRAEEEVLRQISERPGFGEYVELKH